MGNYKKTVKCSWCHAHGHNRITCPALKEHVETYRDLYGNDHPKVQEYDARKNRYSTKSSRNANKRRACTYCSETGHNRRTCGWLKDHKEVLLEKNLAWRKSVARILQREGVCVGSLVSYNSEGYLGEALWSSMKDINNKDLWMVIKINWDDINFFESCDEAFTISLMKRPSTKRRISLESLIFSNTQLYKSNECIWKIISKGSSLNLPDKWLSDNTNILTKVEAFFGDLTKEAYEEAFLLEAEDRNCLINNVLKEVKDDEKEEKG